MIKYEQISALEAAQLLAIGDEDLYIEINDGLVNDGLVSVKHYNVQASEISEKVWFIRVEQNENE